jgi:hypothetical protein
MSESSPSREQGGCDHGSENIAPAHFPAIAISGLVGFRVIAAFKATVRGPSLQLSRRGRRDRTDRAAVAVAEALFHGGILSGVIRWGRVRTSGSGPFEQEPRHRFVGEVQLAFRTGAGGF